MGKGIVLISFLLFFSFLSFFFFGREKQRNKQNTYLQPPTLVMQIMKHGPVAVDPPKRVPRKHVPAMIANGLDRSHTPKEHALPGAQLGDFAGEDKGEDVEEQGLEPVGVDGAVSVRDVEAVVLGVDEAVEGAVYMAKAVCEIDPGVDDDEGEEVLEGRRENAGEEFGEEEFDGGEGVGDGWVLVASNYSSEGGAGALCCVAELFCIDTNGVQEDWDDAASPLEDGGGVVDLASLVPGHCWAVAVAENKADGDVQEMVADDCFEAFPSCDVVSLELIFRRMDSIIAKQLVDIKHVEECACDGINDSRQYDSEDIVTNPGEYWFLWS